MPRLVHLAPASATRSIERAGVRGGPWTLVTATGDVAVPRAVFAMPVLGDFSKTYQWLRELRRRGDERLVAVHVALKRTDEVYVGRYGQAHERLPVGEAIQRIMRNHVGLQIVVPRPVRAREVVAIRDVPQLVGWVETPEARTHYDCVCAVCVWPGRRDLQRRVRAAYSRCLMEARATPTDEGIAMALGRMDVPLERARGQLLPRRLLKYTRSASPAVRATVASLLGYFRQADVDSTLARLTSDPNGRVRENAVAALVHVAGLQRTCERLKNADVAVVDCLLGLVAMTRNLAEATATLLQLAARDEPAVQRAIRSVAQQLLDDDDGAPPELRAKLESLAAAV